MPGQSKVICRSGCFGELSFEQKVSQSWLPLYTSLLPKGRSAPAGVTNLEHIAVSITALYMVVSPLALESPFSATHLTCLLILTGVQCRYRTMYLHSRVTDMYVVACVYTHIVEVVPDILSLWDLYSNFKT